MTFSMSSQALILRRFRVRMESLLLFFKIVLLWSLTAWSNSFVCLSTSIYPSCWKFANIQPVPKKGDRSNPSKYLALISCLFKAFESVLNKIMRHLLAHNLLSDCQYGFQKGQSTDDLPAFLTESWSSSFRDFGENFAVGLTYRKPSIESGINL